MEGNKILLDGNVLPQPPYDNARFMEFPYMGPRGEVLRHTFDLTDPIDILQEQADKVFGEGVALIIPSTNER